MLKEQGKEGIVFKRVDALYTPGRPNSGGDQLKRKFYASISALVGSINSKRSIELRLFGDAGPVTAGNVTIPANHTIPKIGQVVEVRYLYAFRESGCFLNGIAHFLPNARLEEVTSKLEQMQQEFWAAKQTFLSKYAGLRRDASKEWRSMAEKLVADPDRLVAAIETSFPYPQYMDRYYGFDVQFFQLALPEKMETDLLSMAEHREVVTARQRAAQEASRKIRQDVETFVADCVASLREQAAQLCEDMLHSINNSETGVHQKTLNRLVRFIDQFKQMNFANDTQMEQQLENVRKELLSKTAEEYRDSSRDRGRLVKGLSALANTARQMAKQDATELVQRFGQVGVRKFNLAA
jgi:hypothetical protein